MKRALSLFLVLILLLSGCGHPAESPTVSPIAEGLTARQLLDAILPVLPEGNESYEIVTDEDIPVFLEIYGLADYQIPDCAIARMGGARVFEVVVLRTDNGDPEQVSAALSAYLLQRQGDFTGYAPDQAALAEQGVLLTAEPWLILVISEDTAEAADAFAACVSGEVSPVTVATPEPSPDPCPEPTDQSTQIPSPEPTGEPTPDPTEEPTPEPDPTEEPTNEPVFELPAGWKEYIPPYTDDMTIYDTSAILAAWETGDPEELMRRDRWVYDRCVELIDQLITEDMSDYEKEWAIYRWLIQEVTYDWRQNDPAQVAPRSSFQPYGALVEGTAVCLGYATTFQLFMDLLGVESIIVTGAAFDSSGDHAWNMVRLNGEWYCVDATWDLGRSTVGKCKYFNVTSHHMAITDHQWDYANTPMATAEDGGVN